jgi:UDP-glucuronate 4-epimerase
MDQVPAKEDEHPYYRILNIGNSQPVQLMDFIRTLETEIGKKAVLEMYPMQKGDVYQTYADTRKLEKLTGYKPQVNLGTGIKKFIHWRKKYMLDEQPQ